MAAAAAADEQRYLHCILVSYQATYIICTENMSLIMEELFQVSNPWGNDDFSFTYKLELLIIILIRQPVELLQTNEKDNN